MVSSTSEQLVDQPHLLVVDDDAGIRDLLSRYLTEQDFRVSAVADGQEMDAWLAGQTPDLVILDLMLPGEDGLSLARRLRSDYEFPIIMISARGEDIDRIVGLEVGADDYLPKPFNPRELLARIRAVLRRNYAPGADSNADTVFSFGPYSLDTVQRILCRQIQEIDLSRAEYELLNVFVRHPNRVLSRDFIMQSLGGEDRDPFDRSIDVRVTRLRHKIEQDPAHPHYIRTVWGAGYQFNPDAAPD
jgi:two-component system phosphate regulon response regulator OmpR